jgi:hypothetical protein
MTFLGNITNTVRGIFTKKNNTLETQTHEQGQGQGQGAVPIQANMPSLPPVEASPSSPLSPEEMFPISRVAFWKRLPWGRLLVWFMRIVAVLWLLKGLMSWMAIIGLYGSFEGRSTTLQATTVYFAVLDLVAAIGLWLLTTWGGVLWLLALMSHLILAFFFPRIVIIFPYGVAAFLGLVMLYLALSWFSSRQE